MTSRVTFKMYSLKKYDMVGLFFSLDSKCNLKLLQKTKNNYERQLFCLS